jgi:hypothetical protein
MEQRPATRLTQYRSDERRRLQIPDTNGPVVRSGGHPAVIGNADNTADAHVVGLDGQQSAIREPDVAQHSEATPAT